MPVTGLRGELRYRYQKAVTLGRWTLDPVVLLADTRRFSLIADIFSVHDPWCTHRPLDLVLQFGSEELFWPEVHLPKTIHRVHSLRTELHTEPISQE
jgi:hypothetical protein